MSTVTRRHLSVLIVGALATALIGLFVILREPSQAGTAPVARAASIPPHAPAFEARPIEPREVESRAPAAPIVDEAAEPARAAPDTAPEEPDLPPEIFEEIEMPPDPIQHGTAVLDLALFDARTHAAVASAVELWRLDAPGNEGWTSGDQLQASATVPEGGYSFTRLPEGAYRVVSSRLALHATPQEIEVRAPRTRIDLELELPGRFAVRLELHDRWGERVAQASVQGGKTRWLGVDAPWRWEREARGLLDFEVSEGWPEMSPPAATPLPGPQPLDGFELGEWGGQSRETPVQNVLRVWALEDAEVRVGIPVKGQGVLRFVAVAASRGEIAARVRLPGGLPAPAEVEVWCEAREIRSAADSWRSAPLHIRAQLEGYREVERTWTPGQGELPWIVLEPDP